MFHIVVADSRAPRDGRYIERLGLYNPNTNPASIDIDFDRSLYWLQTGAQPTDTARAILSYKGVLHKDHLLRGVKKGALTTEQAEDKFNQWLESKEGKISGKVDSLAAAKVAKAQADLERESKLREALEARILAKNSPLSEEVEMSNSEEVSEVVAENEATIETSGSEETTPETETGADTPEETTEESSETSETPEPAEE